MINMVLELQQWQFQKVYKSMQSQPSRAVDPASQIWNTLLQTSSSIILAMQRGESYPRCGNLINEYTWVFTQITNKPSRAEQMFTKYKQMLNLHLVNSASQNTLSSIFGETKRVWSAYIHYAAVLEKRVFAYLDRYFLPGREYGTLNQIAVAIFSRHMFGNHNRKRVFIDNFVSTLRSMRANMVISEPYLRQFTQALCLINPQFYKQIKKVYLQETKNYYQHKFHQFKDLLPCQFYNSASNLLYFEETISNFCLHWSDEEFDRQRAYPRVLFSTFIIQPYTDTLLSHWQGLQWALQNHNLPLLNKVTDIYSQFEGFEKIKKKYYQLIVQRCKGVLQSLQANKPKDNIQAIAIFFEEQQTLLALGFKKHQEMHVTLSNALQELGKWEKLPEILFSVSSTSIRQGLFEVEAQRIRLVFEKLSNKDQFIQKCESWIETIILSDQISLERQEKLVKFVHELCGSQSTLKLNKLLNDYAQSHLLIAQHGIIPCKVISNHLWERRFKDEIAICLNIPNSLNQQWSKFQHFYTAQHPRRKLRLMPLTTILQLQVSLLSGKVLSLRLNLIQASIVYSLSQRGKTEEELVADLNTEKTLIRSFLEAAKFLRLDGSLFAINWESAFSGHQDYTLQVEQKARERKVIEQDRNILLEAGIVRFIKRKKEAMFEEVYGYLCNSIKLFHPQPAMVKSTLQKLAKRDFIEISQQGNYIYKE